MEFHTLLPHSQHHPRIAWTAGLRRNTARGEPTEACIKLFHDNSEAIYIIRRISTVTVRLFGRDEARSASGLFQFHIIVGIGKSEIYQYHAAIRYAHHNITGLQIPVYHSLVMERSYGSHNVDQDAPSFFSGECPFLKESPQIVPFDSFLDDARPQIADLFHFHDAGHG